MGERAEHGGRIRQHFLRRLSHGSREVRHRHSRASVAMVANVHALPGVGYHRHRVASRQHHAVQSNPTGRASDLQLVGDQPR